MSVTRSIMDDLDDRFAEAWVPAEENEAVSGIVVSRSSRDGGYGEYPILTIEQSDGSRIAVHGFSTVLKNEIEAQNPSAGDEIAVRYDGIKPSKDGTKTYKVFSLAVRKSLNPPPVQSLLPPAPRPQPQQVAQKAGSAQNDGDIPF